MKPLTRRHIHQRADLTGRKPATVVFCNGAGVDSMALLQRWCDEPASRDFPLDELLVITAITGNEYASTIAAANWHMIPLLRRHGIRFMQVARAGQATRHGYDVLADSTAPTELIPRGAWHLGQEMDEALTLPQIVTGRRECSYRAKGQVLDSAIAHELEAGTIAPGYRHVIGFAAEEVDRAERDSSYTTNARRPWYPLITWNWDRVRCDQYLFDTFKRLYGIEFHWPRSCCVFCCFQAPVQGRPALADRWRAEPAAAVETLRLERRARGLNRKMLAFGDYAAADFVRDYGLTEVVERASTDQAAVEQWTVVEVRRVYRPASVKDPVTAKSIRGRDGRTVKDPTRKGDTWRSMRPCTTRRTRAEALAALQQIAEQYDAAVVTEPDGVPRLTVRPMPNAARRWPITTHEFTLVPGQAAAKQRRSFDQEWNDARREETRRGGEEILLPLAVKHTRPGAVYDLPRTRSPRRDGTDARQHLVNPRPPPVDLDALPAEIDG